MKRYSIFATALAVLLGMASCSSESQTTETKVEQASDGLITFRFGGSLAPDQAKTRAAAATTSLDYEKNINNVYVVAYKNNNLTAAVEATELTPGSGDWTADVEASGVLDLYFIVNADATLAASITGLAVGTAPSALESLKVTQLPGQYETTATDGFFPMVGKVSNTTVNTKDNTAQGTVLASPVTVTRLAARIDIEVDDLPANFEVTGVTINGRYDESLLVRNDHYMAGLTAPVNDQPADSYSITHATDMPYQGHIYLYEDLDGPRTATAGGSSTAGAQTELVIHGKYTIDGTVHVVHPVVKFDNTVDGGSNDVKVQRNNIYNIKLLPESLTETLKSIAAEITVVDWETGKTITKTTAALTDRSTAPTVAFSDFTNCSETTGNITSADENALSFKVTVTNNGTTTSKLVCITPNDGIGISIVPGATIKYNHDGTSEQEFTVSIPDANAGAANRVFTIRAENMLNKHTYKEFTVTQVAPSI